MPKRKRSDIFRNKYFLKIGHTSAISRFIVAIALINFIAINPKVLYVHHAILALMQGLSRLVFGPNVFRLLFRQLAVRSRRPFSQTDVRIRSLHLRFAILAYVRLKILQGSLGVAPGYPKIRTYVVYERIFLESLDSACACIKTRGVDSSLSSGELTCMQITLLSFSDKSKLVTFAELPAEVKWKLLEFW